MRERGTGAPADAAAAERAPAIAGVTVVRRRRRLLHRLPYLVVGVAAAVWLVGDVDRGGPTHPRHWDARVVDLVRFVEDERGLRFAYPVHVDFVGADEFSRRRRIEEAALGDEGLESMERAARVFEALGLGPPGTDLREASNDLADDGTAAYYDPGAERVVVRREPGGLSLPLQHILVHELTHVLQDQHFGLGPDTDDSDAWIASRVLGEGDADRVQAAWFRALSLREQNAYDRATEETADAAEQRAGQVAAVPATMQAHWRFPYRVGDPLVELLATRGGTEAVDAALRRPPASSEQVMDPRALFEHDHRRDVGEVLVPEGAERVDEVRMDVGAVNLLVLLSNRIDPPDALRAADGWGGSDAEAYEQDGRTCVRMRLAGDTRADTSQIRNALEAWAAAGPAGAAEVVEAVGYVVLLTCTPDPGASAPAGDGGGPLAALDLVSVRLRAMTHALAVGGYTDDEAYDAADCYVRAGYQARHEVAGDADAWGRALWEAWRTCGLPGPAPV